MDSTEFLSASGGGTAESISRRLARAVSSVPVIGGGLLLWLSLLGLALIVTYYNVRYSVYRIASVFAPGERAEPVIPAAVQPLLQDLSLVSPLLVVFTLLCLILASGRLLRLQPGLTQYPRHLHFPFPDAYRGYFVQFGLIGTMVGFVIAFSNINTSLQGQSAILLDALGTALWSTLTAIVLAYGVCPLLELLFRFWLRVRAGLGPETDALAALDELRVQTVAATQSLTALGRSVTLLSHDMDTLQLHNRLARLEQGLYDLSLDIGHLKQHVKALHANQQELQRRLNDAEHAERENNRRFDAVLDRLSFDKAAIEGTDRRVALLEETVGKLLHQLRRALE